jgi:hypothetical protein
MFVYVVVVGTCLYSLQIEVHHRFDWNYVQSENISDVGVWRGVSNRVEEGCRPLALQVGHPCKVVLGWPTRRA